MKKQLSNKVTDQEIRQLVIERLKSLPSEFKLSIGSQGSFDKHQLMKHVETGDEIGQKVIEVQLEFLRSLKSGIF